MKKIISYKGRKSWAGEVSQVGVENERIAVKDGSEKSGVAVYSK